MRHLIRFMIILPVFVLIFLPDISFSAQNQKTALVIGNGAYSSSPLRNPVNDAADITSMLKILDFKVILKTNANQKTMKKSIRNFGKKLLNGGVGLFYYAGHAVQVRGTNYLVPIGAQIESESDAEYEAIDAGRVLGKMEDAGNGLNIIILDACRDNPFARSFRTSEKGLAKMDAPTGSILAYSTAPGSIAADGAGRNGLYTSKLLKHMATPGLEIERVFKKVRIDVVRSSQRQQVPWESSSLIGEFYFNPKRGISVRKEFEVKKQKVASIPQTPKFKNDSPDTLIWPDYSRSFKVGKKRIEVGIPLKVRVNIPETVIKKLKKIPLVIFMDSAISIPCDLTINDDKWHVYTFGGSSGYIKSVVKIPTKLLKPGWNIIKFFKRPISAGRYELVELRFNLSKNSISSN